MNNDQKTLRKSNFLASKAKLNDVSTDLRLIFQRMSFWLGKWSKVSNYEIDDADYKEINEDDSHKQTNAR